MPREFSIVIWWFLQYCISWTEPPASKDHPASKRVLLHLAVRRSHRAQWVWISNRSQKIVLNTCLWVSGMTAMLAGMDMLALVVSLGWVLWRKLCFPTFSAEYFPLWGRSVCCWVTTTLGHRAACRVFSVGCHWRAELWCPGKGEQISGEHRAMSKGTGVLPSISVLNLFQQQVQRKHLHPDSPRWVFSSSTRTGHKRHFNLLCFPGQISERQSQIKARALKAGSQELVCPSSHCFLCLFCRAEFHNFTALKGV